MRSRGASLPETLVGSTDSAVDVVASEQPLRVCMIISSFRPLIGGAERVTERLSAELRRQGADVHILTRRHPGLAKAETIATVPVQRLGIPSRSKLGALAFAVHALWVLATRLRGCRIVHVQNPDTPLLTGFVAKLLLNRRLFVTIQSDPKLVFDRSKPWRRLRLSLMGRLADVVAVQNPAMGRELEVEGVPRERIRVLPNAVDTSRFSPPTRGQRKRARGRLELGESELVYVFVGRLVDLKRVDLLLRAWSVREREARDAYLIVLGDGPERRSLEQLASDLKLEHVRFEGATEDVIPYLHAADVLVHPSSVEGLSLALLEGMATGLPAVASDLPQNQAVVRDGENGLLFAVEDAEQLADRLLQMCSDPLRARLGRSAAATVRRDFTLGAVTRRHIDAYRASGNGAIGQRNGVVRGGS